MEVAAAAADADAQVALQEERPAQVSPRLAARNEAAEKFFGRRRLRDRIIRKLRPRMGTAKPDESTGTTLMSLICTLGALSFRAYQNPAVDGFDEVSVSGNRIKHVNYDVLDDAVEGVLKIHLMKARNVLDADILAGKSDPYVVFSTGWSQVASETKKDDDNPVWNSDHYILLRKPGAVERDTENLTISLYDSDTARGVNAERTFRQRLLKDDFLGSASVPIADFRTPGVHHREVTLQLAGDNRRVKTTVLFTVQYITFAEACTELGKEKESDAWFRRSEADSQEGCRWSELSAGSGISRINFEPIAFLNAFNTGTQAWIHINSDKKAIAIAFRGTEAARLKDLLTDLRFFPTKMKWEKQPECSLELTKDVKQKKIRAHTGFKSAYASVWSSVLTIVQQVTQWKEEWTIYVTGHSLGGALATLCAFEYANREDESGNGPEVVMMNFGAPRVGNKEFVRVYKETVPKSYRVVNRLDIIHRLPRLLTHVHQEVSLEEDGDIVIDKSKSIVKEMRSHSDEDADLFEHHNPKKLTKRSLFKAPGFKGHFENYYFDMVAQAATSVCKGARSQLQYIIDELKEVVDSRDPESEGPSASAENAREGQRARLPESSPRHVSPVTN